MGMFDRLAAASRSVVEAVHGEAVTIIPMDAIAGPNARPSASETRLPFETTACFYSESQPGRTENLRPSAMGAASTLRSPALTASIRLDGRLIRTGDRLARGALAYEIGTIDLDGVGGAIVTLSSAKP